MTYARDAFDTLPGMPSWITSARAEIPEDVAFLSGAALNHLHLVVNRIEVPQSLLRERLALRAAEACVMFEGRPERAGELRDTVAFVQPSDLPGPAGETCLMWRRAVERSVSGKALHRAMPGIEAGQIAEWLDAGAQGKWCTPIARSCAVLETVLADVPRAGSGDGAAALILADAALAQALGWTRVTPLLAAGMKRGALYKTGDAMREACYRAAMVSAAEAVRMAIDLARRAAHLTAVAPKLRAKGAGEAVQMFLSRDAVAPSALPLPDRAARRLCDRLVELGAVRELTGRDTFRLYGV